MAFKIIFVRQRNWSFEKIGFLRHNLFLKVYNKGEHKCLKTKFVLMYLPQ